ncbi:alpha/beta hydrolase [Priestia koreensis]|uniref:alpha/beta fold hydrolase n=1 Tax=Priestia koreensis TaxID=284581 RepID=UPI0028F74D36|nr:alpha/beta hydrolase [Priestia koreensis]
MGYYVNVEENVNVFVEDIGQGKPVVFIHGWPLSHKMYEYQFNALPAYGYRCIGIDLRGFGKSDRPFDDYSYDRMADDIRAVVDALSLENFALVGFSMGGPICIRYMTRHQGHQANKLVLLGAAAPSFTQRENYPYGSTKEEVDTLIHGMYRDRPKTLAEFGTQFFASNVSEPFQEWFTGLNLEASGHGTIRALEALRDEDLRGELADIQAKTYIFHGKKDQICPFEFATIMHDHIPNSQLIPFEESGHGLFYDELEYFNTKLVEVLLVD